MDLLVEALGEELFALGLPLVEKFNSRFAIDVLAQRAVKNFLNHIRLFAVIILLDHILVATIPRRRIPTPFLVKHTIHSTNFKHTLHPILFDHIALPFPLHPCHLQNTINHRSTAHHLIQHHFIVTLLKTPSPSLRRTHPHQTHPLKPKTTLALKECLPLLP